MTENLEDYRITAIIHNYLSIIKQSVLGNLEVRKIKIEIKQEIF